MKKIVLLTAAIGAVFLSSCKSTRQPSVDKMQIEQNTDSEEEVFLKIFGVEPFWNIDIAEDIVVFKDVEGKVVTFKYAVPSEDKENMTKTYHLLSGGYDLTIHIVEGYCTDGMSDKDSAYKADMQLKENGKIVWEHKGCAHYLLHPELEGKWILKQLNHKKISEDGSYATPYLEFDTTENRVSGNTSCNGISGSVITEGSLIKFPHMATTLMMCVNENVEQEFLEVIEQVTRYEIEGNELRLYAGQQLKMLFKK